MSRCRDLHRQRDHQAPDRSKGDHAALAEADQCDTTVSLIPSGRWWASSRARTHGSNP